MAIMDGDQMLEFLGVLLIGAVVGWGLRGLSDAIGRFGHNAPDPISDETDGYCKMDVTHEAAGKLRYIRDYGVDAYIEAGKRGDLIERRP